MGNKPSVIKLNPIPISVAIIKPSSPFKFNFDNYILSQYLNVIH